MSSTLHLRPADMASADKSKSGTFRLVAIAIAMLIAGFILGNLDWRKPGHAGTAGNGTITAPAGSVIYDDWRGNSAGMRKDHRTGR